MQELPSTMENTVNALAQACAEHMTISMLSRTEGFSRQARCIYDSTTRLLIEI